MLHIVLSKLIMYWLELQFFWGRIGVPVWAQVSIGLLFRGSDDSAVGKSVKLATFRQISPKGALTLEYQQHQKYMYILQYADCLLLPHICIIWDFRKQAVTMSVVITVSAWCWCLQYGMCKYSYFGTSDPIVIGIFDLMCWPISNWAGDKI